MLIVIAEKEELKLVKELGYENEPILITGVGGMNVIKALKDLPRDTEILNIGYCGSNLVKKGTRVSVSTINTLHEIAEFKESHQSCYGLYTNNFETTLPCYTSTDFVTHTNIKTPCVFDMELAFIRAMFPNTRAIKVVSDNLNYKEYKNSTK